MDGEGKIISEDISWEAFPEAVQPYPPAPESGGRRLLETKEDGTYDYEKFFDAMYGAAEKSGEGYSQEVLEQFARDHLDVEAYKQEILAAEPDLNSDKAYDRRWSGQPARRRLTLPCLTGWRSAWLSLGRGGRRRTGRESLYPAVQ